MTFLCFRSNHHIDDVPSSDEILYPSTRDSVLRIQARRVCSPFRCRTILPDPTVISYFKYSHLTTSQKVAGAGIVQEIEEIEFSLAKARAQYEEICARLQNSINASEARLGQVFNESHPMLHLPNEILSRIMEEACSGPSKRVMSLDHVRTEILLSHVCQRWRAVAVATPALWTKIVGPDKGDYKTARLEAYLSRSKGCLIDVRINVSLVAERNPAENWCQEFLMIVASHSERWRSFTLRTRYEYFGELWTGEDLVSTLENASVPQLQLVDVVADRPSIGSRTNPQIFLQGTPRLSTLKLSVTDRYWPLVPMHTITTLTIHSGLAPIPIIQLLSLSKLRHLEVVRNESPTYYPIEFDLINEGGENQDGPDVVSELISLRIPSCDLPSLFDIPDSLQGAFQTVKHLFVTIHHKGDSGTTDSDSNVSDDEWDEWPLDLQEQLESTHCDMFPSLEHLIVNTTLTEYDPTLPPHPSLCRLTCNISKLTIIRGYLDLFEDEDEDVPVEEYDNGKSIWPRLSEVHFEELPVDSDDFQLLMEWMTERGRRPGTFTATLTRGAMGRLKRKRKVFEKEIREMMEVVRLEKGHRVSWRNMWPPKDV